MNRYRERIDTLAARAQADRESFRPPSDPPAEDQALAYLRSGVGDVLALYIEARSEGVPLGEREHARLERALNDWFDLYAACYGRDIDAAFAVRETAEVLVATHDLRDTARLLTHVPTRNAADSTKD